MTCNPPGLKRSLIAIVAAVPEETRILRRSLFPCEVRRCGSRELYCGNLFGHKITVLHTGIGKINAASAITALLEHYAPEILVTIGCCGVYPGQGLNTGDLVLASEEICADEGVVTPDGFRDFASLGFPLIKTRSHALSNRFDIDPKLRESARPPLEAMAAESGLRLGIGPLVTVSTCSGTLGAGRDMQTRTGGLGENMEGAAAAQVCQQYHVPFLELRGVSNLVEDRNLDSWDLDGAAENAQQALMALLRKWYAPVELA